MWNLFKCFIQLCRCNRKTSDISLTAISGGERLVKRISVLSRVFIMLFCVVYVMRLIHYLRVVVMAPTSQCHNIHLLFLRKMGDVWICEKYIESVFLSFLAEDNIVQKIKRWKPMSKRPIGRPKTRWEDEVLEDIKSINISNWKKVAQNRDSWKNGWGSQNLI